ncbi:MAG: hypothetical protein WCG27_06355 [Pseudomonadota bacterium]
MFQSRLAHFFQTGICLILIGCAASPNLTNYPRRQIDRPFNLPEGMNSFSTIGIFQRDTHEPLFGPRYSENHWLPLFPSTWQKSFSSRWGRSFSLLPPTLLAMYQIKADEKMVCGLNFGISSSYSTADGFYWGLSTSYYHRQLLNRSWALEFAPTLMLRESTSSNNKKKLRPLVILPTGGLHQLTETLALRAGIIPTWWHERRLKSVEASLNNSSYETKEDWDYKWRFVLPLYTEINWSASRRWDISGSVTWRRIGEYQQQQSWMILYAFTHFW